MKRILTALVLIPLVLLLVFRGGYLTTFVVFLVALLAIHEYLSILRAYGLEPLWTTTYISATTVFALLVFAPLPEKPYSLMLFSFFGLVYLVAALRAQDMRQGFLSAVCSYFALPFIALALATLIFIRHTQVDAAFWLVILFATVWAGDSAAMYTGKLIGRHKLAPVISPKKTWEGSIGSVIGSLVFALLAFRYYHPILSLDRSYRDVAITADIPVPHSPNILPFITLVIALNIAAQLGDLAESVIKRGAGVKDSGTLLPGHGGILDRIDALLFAAPVLWYYLAITRP